MIDRLKFWFAFLREPQRWSMAGLAIVFGTVALILADGFIEQIFVDFREAIVRSNLGHFQVRLVDAGHAAGEGTAETSPALVALRPSIEQALTGFPGTVVAARLSFVGLASHGERTVSFIGEGVEPLREQTLSSQLVVDRGHPLESADGQSLLVGEGLAKNLGVDVGDLVTLLVTTGAGGVSAIEASVVGIFHTSTKAWDDRALRLPLPLAQALLREEAISKLVGVLPRSSQTDAAVASLRAALADDGVEVLAWRDLADFYNKTVQLFSSQLALVRAVIVAIVLLSVSNTLARNVMERTSEIGTMMALGRTRVAVARLFVGEGLALGLVCGVVGVTLGWMLAIAISGVGIPMPPPPGMARGFIARIAFTPGIATVALLFAVITAVIASLLPALRASRLNIVDALRVGR